MRCPTGIRSETSRFVELVEPFPANGIAPHGPNFRIRGDDMLEQADSGSSAMSTDLFEPTATHRYRAIGDYSAAVRLPLHGTGECEGSIDWACLRRSSPDPRPRSRRLLEIRPTEPIVERSRRYIDHTMVLETTLTTASGTS